MSAQTRVPSFGRLSRLIGSRRAIVGAVVVVALGAASLIPLVAVPRAPREITIVARDMTFYLDGRGRPNPTIRLAAGERVRIVLRNEDAGLTHDVVVRSLGIAAPTLKGLGSTSVTVEVPDAPGRHTYTCTPHAKMMSGLVEVR